MKKDSLKKIIMVFLSIALFMQPLSTVLVYAKGIMDENKAIKLISEKLDEKEDLSNGIERYASLTIYPIGDLPIGIESEIVLLSKDKERFSKIIKDNKPIRFEGLLHDIYDVELNYTNQNGEEIQISKSFDLRDESIIDFEYDLPTHILNWNYGEVEVSPNYQEIELFSPNTDEIVEKLFLETEIIGDELILRGVKEEDINEMDAENKNREDFIMHIYDKNSDETFDIVGEEIELTKEEKKEYGKRIYESDYRIDLRDLKSNEIEVEFIRGENQSYIQKIYLNNLGYEKYKNSIEKNEKEKASSENNGLIINDEEVFKLDGLSPMIIMRSLTPRGVGDTWEVTPTTFTGTKMNIDSVSVEETGDSLVWTVKVDQKILGSLRTHHHIRLVKAASDGVTVTKVEAVENGTPSIMQNKGSTSYYVVTDDAKGKGKYTYRITTEKPTGSSAKLPFKIFGNNKKNNATLGNSFIAETEFTATKSPPAPDIGSVDVNINYDGDIPSTGNIVLKQGGVEKFSQSLPSANGIVSFADIPVGDYTVEIIDMPTDYIYSPGNLTATITKDTVSTVDITVKKEMTPIPGGQNFNIITKDNESPANIVPGVKVQVTDDTNTVVEGTTNANGKIALTGSFTDKGNYTLTIVSVPAGYKMPSPNTVDIVYNQKAGNPNQSTEVEVIVEKVDGATVEIKSDSQPVTDATINLEIYDGATATGTPIKTVEVPPGQRAPVDGLVNGQEYTFKVKSSVPEIYETGGISNIIFNEQEPHIVVNVNKKTTENKLVVNFHEDKIDGALTTKLENQILKLSVNGTVIQATIINGVATFLNPEQGEYTLVEPAPSVDGYKLVVNSPFTLNNTNGYQDWILIKNGAKVILNAKPPKGMAFPDTMTVKLVKAASQEVVSGPNPIGNGVLIFEDIPQDENYQFIYENVPANWTHENALATPFKIPKDAIETTVTDQFGYNDPASDQSLISVKVVDNDHNPMSGFEFQVKNSSNQVVATVSTGTDGVGKTSVNKLPPGIYTVENTVVPTGYLKVEFSPVLITEDKPNIRIDAMTGKDGTQNQSNLYINLTDEDGNPIPNEWLEFYKVNNSGTETLVTSEIQTDGNGDTYIAPLNVEDGYKYKIKLKKNSNYQLKEVDGETYNIIIEKGISKQLNIQAGVKDGFGRILAYAHTKEGDPAPNLKIKVKKDGNLVPVDSFRTLLNGKNSSKFLEYGDYEVILEESNTYKLANDEISTKTVSITEMNKTPEVEFLVEKKAYDAGTAGSITVAGHLIGEEGESMKTSWIITVDKFESTAPTKRGTINTLRISAKEMINPNKPVLLKKVGDGPFEEVPVEGDWVRTGDYFEFIDKHNKSTDLTSEEVIYQYSFQAIGLDTADKYSTTATADIVSNNPAEIIAPVSATHTLNKDESEPMIDLNGTGEGVTDNINRKVNWSYHGQVDPKVPGDLYFIMKRPEDSGLMPVNNTVKPVVTIYDKEGNIRDDINYDVIFDPDLDAYKIKFDTNLLSPFDFDIDYEMDIDDQQGVNEYKIETKYEYQGYGMDYPKTYVPLTLTSTKLLPLPGKKTENLSTCPNAKHRTNLYGEMSNDGTEIIWTARVTNLDKDEEFRPFTMDFDIGEGLGDAELLSINSVGRSFPFVTKGNTTTDYVYDKAGDHIAGKTFRAHSDATSHYIGPNDTTNFIGTYNYLTSRSTVNYLGVNVGPFNFKTDLQNNDYFLRWNSIMVNNSLSEEEDQGLEVGDYLEVSFKTPITDFSRMREKDADGNYLGYKIDVKSNAFDEDAINSTNTATPVCSSNTELVLREEKNQGGNDEKIIIKSEKGEVIASGKYVNDGNDIQWQIEVNPLREQNLGWISQLRHFKVKYSLVDSSNNPLGDTGLGAIENRDYQKIEGNGFTLNTTESSNSGEFIIKNVNMNEKLIYKFTTPVISDKPDYRLKVEGFYTDRPIIEDWVKLQDGNTSNVAYVIVDGKNIEIKVNKKWENVYPNAEKPNITLRLKQLSIEGEQKELTARVLTTPNSDKFIDTVFVDYDDNGILKPIPRFDENGYRYQYFVREDFLEDYESHVIRMNGQGTIWNIINTKNDKIPKTEDPINYVNREDGTYPEPNQQDGPDIRNADTKLLNTLNEPYKVEYEDSIVGKSGQQTDVPGMFDMKLSIEGKNREQSTGLDVVFVLDNSESMKKNWSGNLDKYQANQKLYQMNQKLNGLIDEVLKEPGSRVGIVNFATDNYRKGNGNKPGYRHYSATTGEYEYATYNLEDMVELTANKDDIDDALPTAVRFGGALPASQNTGDINIRNSHPGLTNIAGAVAKAGDLLYPSGDQNPNNKKIMIVLSDGAPTASVKLKNYPLDTNLSLSENLTRTGTGNEYAEFIMANNRYYLQNQTYVTDNGVRIEDNGLPAIAISEYYQKIHPDMDIYSLAIAKDASGFEMVGRNDYGPQEEATVIMERVLRSITTNYQKNYYEAENADELENQLELLKNSIQSRSIVNGEVVDPMGDQIVLKTNADGFTPKTLEDLAEGGYYLSDNRGNYMDIDGTIKNDGSYTGPNPKNLLEGVQVVREGNGFKIKGLNLGQGEEVTLQYRAHLKTEGSWFSPDLYYQANKTTTLNPQPAKGDFYRHFPIPSVKAPHISLEVKKYWFIDMEEFPNTPVDLNHWIDINWAPVGNGLSDTEKANLKAKYDQKLAELGAKPIIAQIYRYEGKTNPDGTPIIVDNHPVKADNAVKTLVREVELNSANNWNLNIEDLAAYNNEGALFVYEVEEKTAVDGFITDIDATEQANISYSKETGYISSDDPSCISKNVYKIRNVQEEHPLGSFEILKVDGNDNGVLLKDAEFTLMKDDFVIATKLTGLDGRVGFGNLDQGNYTLKETKAPPGYKLSNRVYTVKVGPETTANNNLKYNIIITYEENGSTITLDSVDTDNFVYQIDNESMELPNTGYTPVFPTALFGLAVMILMAALYIYKVNMKEVDASE
ncbi:MAG: SpaA isopeptide-forming pilin-related protein [Andreesenia angusta]|nr:SpaA isopeptide-forming pilin-related protein [Andreesenia angusta]